YYFNARWYDPDLGRFISEDPARDPNNPNLYSYCGNNPVMRVDPDGRFWQILIPALLGGLNSYLCGGDFLQGFVMGAFTGALGVGIGSVLENTALNAFALQVVGGAIAGGIMGEISGEGFREGAIFGAFSGAVSWGVQEWFGNSLDKWAGDDPKKIAFVNSVKRMAVAVGTGGDPVEAAGYGAINSFVKNIMKDKSTAEQKKLTAEIKEIMDLDLKNPVVEVGYRQMGPFAHSLIIISSDNHDPIILEGMPEHQIRGILGRGSFTLFTSGRGYGNLIKKVVSNPDQISQSDRQIVPIPEGMTSETFAKSLLIGNLLYSNDMPYIDVPGLSLSHGANSNSFVGSLLRLAGSDFRPDRLCPGWDRDIWQ
ncbi:MAG: RHS repeat-associated core domain-containing protein, partial [Firmicutes bacterium]|nr:RHS repeat-associated core domain-containing protein [Bacillota bacterium]